MASHASHRPKSSAPAQQVPNKSLLNQLERAENDLQKMKKELGEYKKDLFFEKETHNRTREALDETPLLLSQTLLHELGLDESMINSFDEQCRISLPPKTTVDCS